MDDRPDAAAVAEGLREVLRDELGLTGADGSRPPKLLADGVTARAFAVDLNGRPLVLRVFVPSEEESLPADQHRVEAALQNALADLGYPAPRVLASGDASSPLGAPFILMERAAGRSLMGVVILGAVGVMALGVALSWIPLLVFLATYWFVMVRLLLRLHDVPGSAVRARLGAAGVGPERLSSDAILDEMEEWVERDGRDGRRLLMRWLRESAPNESEPQVVCHGDFWFGNLMAGLRGVVVLDWTQARLSAREFDLGWIRIQHYSRIPLPLPEPAYDVLASLIRPLAWLLLGANGWIYGLVHPVDPDRLRYFTVLNAARILLAVEDRRRSCDPKRASGDALLLAWGSPITRALLRRRLCRLTGIARASFET